MNFILNKNEDCAFNCAFVKKFSVEFGRRYGKNNVLVACVAAELDDKTEIMLEEFDIGTANENYHAGKKYLVDLVGKLNEVTT